MTERIYKTPIYTRNARRAYYERNTEKIKAHAREYYANNKSLITDKRKKSKNDKNVIKTPAVESPSNIVDDVKTDFPTTVSYQQDIVFKFFSATG